MGYRSLSVKQWDGWGNSPFIWVCVKKIFEDDKERLQHL